MAISKDIVQKFVESAIKSEILEESFIAFTLPSTDDNKFGDSGCQNVKKILLSMNATSEPDKIIEHYVNLMAQVKSASKFDGLFDVLRRLVREHPNLSKAVCEALLSCKKLDYYDQNSWMKSFALISEIMPHVDYKGVRDILKYILERIYSLPEQLDIAPIPQLDTLCATFSMILDREACLLPAYLSLDELQKKVAQDNAPVWKFAELFYHFIESFRPTAQIFSIINRPYLLPIVGYSTCHANPSWRLDPISAKFQLKGLLPYKDKLKEPQSHQVRYLLEQPYSREMIFNALSLSSKPNHNSRCAELIEQIACSFIAAMERSETNIENYPPLTVDSSEILFHWSHLSNNILFYIIYNQSTISFNHLIDSLCEKIRAKNLRRGKEHLMWAILQYITGTTKSNVNDFLPVIKLFDLLYSGRNVLPVPKEDFPLMTHTLAAATVWLQLVKRAEIDQCKLPCPMPNSIQRHYEYLINLKYNDEKMDTISFREAVLLNSHSSSKNTVGLVSSFVDCLCKIDPVNNPDPMQVAPLPIILLDSLTTHSKLALLHSLAQRIIQLAQVKPGTLPNCILTPALVETYGRLLIYTDSESFGVKSFINHLMSGTNAVWRLQAWHIYHVLLELYSYRVHHVPMHYKFQMLISLHNLSHTVFSANLTQVSMTMESVELKLLMGLANYEALNMPISSPRHPGDTKAVKHMFNGDSEELNKVLVLVLARATHLTSSENVTGSFLEEILNDINRVTPLSWSSSTMNFFPSIIKDFFMRHNPPRENDRAQLRTMVDEEYRKWKAMANDPNIVAHFSQPNAPPLFICILWRMVLDKEFPGATVYRVLDNIRTRTLSAHLRTFVDYFVHEFANSVAGQHVNKYAEALNDLVWKFQVISLDRLLLCMCLRSFENCEAQVCFFIIQLLLLKISDFKSTVQKFCQMQSPEHWKSESKCYEVNATFLKQHPEKFYRDFLASENIPTQGQALPSFFGNVCLRFIPVFDILIHRALELRIMSLNAAFKIDALLDELGCLYKFHDKPITYLYNTMHYYDPKLPSDIKRKLTATIIGSFKDYRPPNWCLSEAFTTYLEEASSKQPPEEWVPDQEYYKKLIGRLVDVIQNRTTFYHTDWRFNEFLNGKSHAVHSVAVELMALPQPPQVVGNALLDIILAPNTIERSAMPHWMNAIGLIMTALPQSYYEVLNQKILEYMKSPILTNPVYTRDILHLIDFGDVNEWMYKSQISYLVALTHAVWHHASTGQILRLAPFWRFEIKQAVETESQFLFVCCLIGPFLPRLERSRVMMDVVVELYEMLGKVDSTSDILHLSTICDFLYHIKYMFTGDAVKNEIERCIKNFKPKLRNYLRFITHLNVSHEQNVVPN